MRFFLLFLSLAMLAACGQSQDKQPKSYDGYFVCKKDKDCSVVLAVCGTPEAINKKFLQSYEKYTADLAKSTKCAIPPEIDWSKLSADCFENTCRVIEFEAQLESSP